MLQYLLFAIVVGVSVAGCSAPQGKRLAANQALAPVATGPALKAATLSWENKGQVVTLQRGATVTAVLESNPKDGYSWKLSGIPDPTVLKLVSKNYVPAENPGEHGKEKWVFQSMGPGDVEVRLWYGNLRPGEFITTPLYDFVASVENRPPPTVKRR